MVSRKQTSGTRVEEVEKPVRLLYLEENVLVSVRALMVEAVRSS